MADKKSTAEPTPLSRASFRPCPTCSSLRLSPITFDLAFSAALVTLPNWALATEKEQKAKASMNNNDDLAEKIQAEINHHLNEFGRILTKEIIPLLDQNGIVFYYNADIKETHKKEIKEIFCCKVLAFLQPVFLNGNDGHHFLPENNQLYFAVTMQESDGTTLKQAVVNIPSNKLQRFFTLSPIDGKEHVIFVDDIIRENMNFLFLYKTHILLIHQK